MWFPSPGVSESVTRRGTSILTFLVAEKQSVSSESRSLFFVNRVTNHTDKHHGNCKRTRGSYHWLDNNLFASWCFKSKKLKSSFAVLHDVASILAAVREHVES